MTAALILTTLRKCMKCGSEDWDSRGRCKNCRSIDAKANYYKTRERQIASATAWAASNKERRRVADSIRHASNYKERSEKLRAWYKDNSEKAKANSRAWKLDNPEANRIIHQNRRSRSNGGALSKGLINQLFKLQRGKCPCCSKPLGDDYHLDHKMPLALGGLNTDDNMQLLRAVCNMQKHSKHPIDFMQSKGFLL